MSLQQPESILPPQTQIIGNMKCVVCDSPYMMYVRHVPTRRTKREIPLYYCINCGSFSNKSGYREDSVQLKKDLDWNISKIERNTEYANYLLTSLHKRIKPLTSIMEIGCGIGTMLHIASEAGMQVCGYDVNQNAVDYGRKEWGLNLHSELWNRNTVQEKYDLVTCISVLEHIDEPRGLIEEIAAYCDYHGSDAYISVPFFEKENWHYLLDPDPYKERTPFFDNDVHVTHFTIKGLTETLYSFNARVVEPHFSGWQGVLARFNKLKPSKRPFLRRVKKAMLRPLGR